MHLGGKVIITIIIFSLSFVSNVASWWAFTVHGNNNTFNICFVCTFLLILYDKLFWCFIRLPLHVQNLGPEPLPCNKLLFHVWLFNLSNWFYCLLNSVFCYCQTYCIMSAWRYCSPAEQMRTSTNIGIQLYSLPLAAGLH